MINFPPVAPVILYQPDIASMSFEEQVIYFLLLVIVILGFLAWVISMVAIFLKRKYFG